MQKKPLNAQRPYMGEPYQWETVVTVTPLVSQELAGLRNMSPELPESL